MTLPLGSADALGIGNEIYHSQQDGALGFGMMQHVSIAVPLATIQAKTSGVAFAVGSVLPANCRLVDYNVNVLTALSGGGAASATATLQGGTDAAGSLVASHSVFTGANPTNSPIGSNPYPSRGGQQIFMTLTASVALSALTAGSLSIDLFYTILP